MDRTLLPFVRLCLLLAAALLLPGCEWFGGETDEDMDDADVVIEGLDDLDGEDLDDSDGEPIPVADEGKNLALNLSVGDRFPLIKSVQQVVTQASAGETVTSHSLLKMILEINVEEIKNERTRMSVRYHRINYTQEVDGEQLTYDSNNADDKLDPRVAAYQGMIDNQFSFWVGRENKIEELVGFQDFLKRCFRNVPPAERQATLNQMTSSSGEQGVANFVDDSIGLLPFGAEEDSDGKSGLSIGDVWQRSRMVELPVPMEITDKCLLTELDDNIATIDILGRVGPVTSDTFRTQTNQPIQIDVRGGTSTGKCLIDRRSGLPIRSNIERQIEMVVRMPGGQEFEQTKQIITTIAAFPTNTVTEPVQIGRNAAPTETPSTIPPRGGIGQTSGTREIEYSDDELPQAFAEPDELGSIENRRPRRQRPGNNREATRTDLEQELDFGDDLP